MFHWLLRLYPASFRNEYGREMQSVFARQRRDAQTAAGVAALWTRVIVDTCLNAASVHWDILKQDLRYTIRTLSRTPAFALTALAVVGLGVGATTAAFSVADFVLLRPLPFPEAHRLVKVWQQLPSGARVDLSPGNYGDWKRAAKSFDVFAAYRGLSANFVGASQPLRLQGAVFTAEVLTALGIRPVLGRAFTTADDQVGAPRTVLLSYGLWQREFGGRESVLGQAVKLDDRVHTVIGVMPRDFKFPTRDAQLWTPMQFAPVLTDRSQSYLQVIARLRSGVSFDQARSEMELLAAQSKQQYPKENEYTGATVLRLRDELSQQRRTMLFALMGAAACVLLIACANLTNLLLARAITRRREIAVRTALGAGRERLVRQLLTESLLLTGAGGVLGLALAIVTVPVLAMLVPGVLPIAEAPSLDMRILALAAGITLTTGIALSLVPLLQQHRDRSSDGLREGARAGGGNKEGLRGALVVVEITASVVLLVVCGLLLRALWTIQAVDPGFDRQHTLAVRTSLPMPKYETTAPRTAFYARVLSEIRALPGVSTAAYVSFLPMGDMRGGVFPVAINGRPDPRPETDIAFLRFATPDYFQTLGISLRRGRDISDSDRSDSPAVAVVSESFVARFFPDRDPIGRRFQFARGDREIVGVVSDVRMRGLTRANDPQVYLPHQQVLDRTYEWFAPKDLVVRSSAEPLSLVPMVRAIVHKADPEVPVSDVQTLEQLVDADSAPRVTQLRVIGAFALVAVLLGGIGIHGLLAFAVSARTREIGVRLALGARQADVVAMIAKRSLTLAAIGIIVGTALAYASGRGMESLLVGVTPGDRLTFAAAIGLALATALAGSLGPAWRAARVDPVSAIRLE